MMRWHACVRWQRHATSCPFTASEEHPDGDTDDLIQFLAQMQNAPQARPTNGRPTVGVREPRRVRLEKTAEVAVPLPDPKPETIPADLEASGAGEGVRRIIEEEGRVSDGIWRPNDQQLGELVNSGILVRRETTGTYENRTVGAQMAESALASASYEVQGKPGFPFPIFAFPLLYELYRLRGLIGRQKGGGLSHPQDFLQPRGPGGHGTAEDTSRRAARTVGERNFQRFERELNRASEQRRTRVPVPRRGGGRTTGGPGGGVGFHTRDAVHKLRDRVQRRLVHPFTRPLG